MLKLQVEYKQGEQVDFFVDVMNKKRRKRKIGTELDKLITKFKITKLGNRVIIQ